MMSVSALFAGQLSWSYIEFVGSQVTGMKTSHIRKGVLD